MGIWIAIYAAVVATASALWQAVVWWLERRPNIRVSTFIVSLVPATPRPANEPDEWIRSLPWRLQIEVLNLGRSTVRIGSVDVETNRSEVGYEAWKSVEWGLPWVLEPGDERVVALTDEQAGKLETGQELVIVVATTAGAHFTDTLVVGKQGMQLVAMTRAGFSDLAPDSSGRFYTAQHSVFGSIDDDDPLQAFLRRGLGMRSETEEEPSDDDVPQK